jgi:hypothetical protein
LHITGLDLCFRAHARGQDDLGVDAVLAVLTGGACLIGGCLSVRYSLLRFALSVLGGLELRCGPVNTVDGHSVSGHRQILGVLGVLLDTDAVFRSV